MRWKEYLRKDLTEMLFLGNVKPASPLVRTRETLRNGRGASVSSKGDFGDDRKMVIAAGESTKPGKRGQRTWDDLCFGRCKQIEK